MNHTKAYAMASGRNIRNEINPDGTVITTAEDDNQKEQTQDNAARVQARHQWLQSTVTQELLIYLNESKNILLSEAMINANTFAQTGNYQTVINKLVKASQLEELLEHIKTT